MLTMGRVYDQPQAPLIKARYVLPYVVLALWLAIDIFVFVHIVTSIGPSNLYVLVPISILMGVAATHAGIAIPILVLLEVPIRWRIAGGLGVVGTVACLWVAESAFLREAWIAIVVSICGIVALALSFVLLLRGAKLTVRESYQASSAFPFRWTVREAMAMISALCILLATPYCETPWRLVELEYEVIWAASLAASSFIALKMMLAGRHVIITMFQAGAVIALVFAMTDRITGGHSNLHCYLASGAAISLLTIIPCLRFLGIGWARPEVSG